MINCMILDIDLSEPFLSYQRQYTSQRTEYKYENYVNDTNEDRENMIHQINNAIDQLS